MYSDFYEIPLPALCFEKVEETDTIKWKNDTEENDAFQIEHVNTQEKDDAWNNKSRNSLARDDTQRKNSTTLTTLKEKQNHSQENDTQRRLKNASKPKAFVIREIKLTHRKNGH